MPLQKTSLAFLLALLFLAGRAAADWPAWRGPNDRGSAEGGKYPAEFNAQTTLWKADLPGKGCSTPIVVDQTIYVTAPSGGRDAVMAIDWSGKQKWITTFGSEIPGKHRNGSGCNASPVSDGNAIFVYFKSGTLAAVETNGKVRWKTNLVERYGKEDLFWDQGTSPVLTERHVIVARMHGGDSWLAAFDRETGELAWKAARNYDVPVENDHGYTSPVVMKHNGKEVLLVWGAEHLTMHDSRDGKIVWSCTGFNPDSNKLWPTIALPVIVDDVAVVPYGRNDKGSPRLYGVRLDGSGNVGQTNHVWMRDDISTFVPTPIAYKGSVYLVRDRGQVECLDPATGENRWSDAFPKGRASYYASPLIAGDYLFAPREDGVVFVASVADGKFKFLAENDMGQPVIGSPVPASENRLLIRGEKELFCLQLPEKQN